MNLLLDTHVVLWWRGDAERIAPAVREAIASADTVFVSVASAWEIAIKQALGRVRLPETFATGVDRSGFARLTITFEHAAAAARLPRHHADPFDRMLIAQAMAEGLRLVSADRAIARYGADVLPAR
ncbi:MAG TPA: type II toxin-antitoxin system VapC family toxin [Polyangiaceae bacterium]|nr:type II toxin-antitoxin system VapC family toxin [Polyangiaceae bacterium]